MVETFTFCGVWTCGSMAILLINMVSTKSTRALVAYDEPVRIRYKKQAASKWLLEVA